MILFILEPRSVLIQPVTFIMLFQVVHSLIHNHYVRHTQKQLIIINVQVTEIDHFSSQQSYTGSQYIIDHYPSLKWTNFISDCVTAYFGSSDHVNSVMLEQRVKEGHLIGDSSRLSVTWQKPSIDFTTGQCDVSPSSWEGQRRSLRRRKTCCLCNTVLS